ncbi:heat shock 70 kDa protein 12A-like [Saccostrea cucullata]|uniref:heat shock 70 kDa protein 12A-like n=1 Tax=Saccostrea cuccullata TaxID=36930 RepID=UPI002ED28792
MNETCSLSDNQDLFVVAIDFGTSYTGYAYSQRDDFEKDPLRIMGMRIGSTNNHVLAKEPTSVLLTPSDKFYAFGKSAEDIYAEKYSSGETGWRLFKYFKMNLYNTENKKTNREMMIEDCKGVPMPAMEVFRMLLRHLKETFARQLEESMNGISDDFIRWVITVPAIWDDSAKQFMREAAEKPGMKKSKIILALEPECAAMYCGTKSLQLRPTLQRGVQQFIGPGSRYMYVLLDIGGGTIDITAHEVNKDFLYDELFAANGGPWGGDNVNSAFYEYLCKIFTKEKFLQFCQNSPDGLNDLEIDFERKKRIFGGKKDVDNKYIVIKLPYSLFKDFPLETPRDLAVIENDKLKIPVNHMQAFFETTLNKISTHIREKMRNKELENINKVIMVGGFSIANIVKDHLKSIFPGDTKFLCPDNSEIATLLGAVIYGQTQIHKLSPQKRECSKQTIITPMINSRRSRYSYGIDSHICFNPKKHPINKKFKDGMEEFCKDVFWVLLKAGSILHPTLKGRMSTFTIDKTAKTLDVDIYRTESPNPKIIDEPECYKLGTLVVDMSEDVGTKNREIQTGLQYNDTELSVFAINNDRMIKATFDALSTV